MEDDAISWFKRNFYDNLYSIILSNEDLVADSIIASYISKPQSKRIEWLKLSLKSQDQIPFLNELLKLEYIRLTNDRNKYAITAKGIWAFENSNSFVDFIDGKYFAIFPKAVDLTDKEKVGLFSMIAVRSFSINSPVNLTNNKVSDWWKDILIQSNDFLKSNNVVKEDFVIDPTKIGNQHPSNYFFSRLNNLNVKTKGIYKSPGERKYYLDLCNSEITDLPIDDLSYLFSLVFKDKITKDTIYEIDNFCRQLSISMGSKIFDRDKHIFIKPKYGEQIRVALTNSVLE